MKEIIQLMSKALPEIIAGLVVAAIISILGMLYRRESRRKNEIAAPKKYHQASIISDKAKLLLHQLLVNRFDEEELQDFCFYLSVDYDSLPGERKSSKAWEFIGYLEQNHLVYDLIRLGSQLRPDISWSEILLEEKTTTLDSEPNDISIITPNEDLSPRLTAFSGRWAGHWGGALPSNLIVESINSEVAVVVYTWGDHPSGKFSRGWNRIKVKVVPPGKIKFGTKVKFCFEIDVNQNVVYGTRQEQDSTSSIVMKRNDRPL
jgi:hypothetical protein